VSTAQDRGAGTRPWRRRATGVAVTSAVVAAFGPYTPIAGIRTEQVVIYGLCAIALVSLRWTRFTIPRRATLVFVLIAAQVLIAVAGSLLPVPDLTGFGRGSTPAGLDNLVLPLAVLVTVWTLLDWGVERERLLTILCRVVIAAMCLNAVLAYWSQAHDLTPVLSRFWDNTAVSDTFTDTVAGRASQLGRYTGIFNQPAEAGEMYSFALLAAIYQFRASTLKFAVAGLLITVGGLLTVSKVFLLVGLPIAGWQVLRQSTGRSRRMVLLVSAAVATAALAQSGIGPRWIGGDFLAQLLHPGASHDVLDLYTGGRLGDESSLHSVVTAVLHHAPWFGFGAAGLAVPYDNGWVEALCVAGLSGAVLYTVLLAAIAACWIRRGGAMPPEHSRLGGGLVLLLIGASVGLPALTANRVATVAWLLLGVLLLAPATDHAAPAPVDEPPDTGAPTGTRGGGDDGPAATAPAGPAARPPPGAADHGRRLRA
jgi:hypothetical protein